MEMAHFMNIVTHLVKRSMLACGWKCIALHNFNAGREKKFVRHCLCSENEHLPHSCKISNKEGIRIDNLR